MFEKPLNHDSVLAENSVLASNISHPPVRNDLIDSLDSSITACVLRVNFYLSRLDSVEIYQTIEKLIVADTIFETKISKLFAI
jgi:hypothetical protein